MQWNLDVDEIKRRLETCNPDETFLSFPVDGRASGVQKRATFIMYAVKRAEGWDVISKVELSRHLSLVAQLRQEYVNIGDVFRCAFALDEDLRYELKLPYKIGIVATVCADNVVKIDTGIRSDGEEIQFVITGSLLRAEDIFLMSVIHATFFEGDRYKGYLCDSYTVETADNVTQLLNLPGFELHTC